MSETIPSGNHGTSGFTPRIFSGIQPSGGLTLGNYLGALKRFAALQGAGAETIYCIVDLHAITVWQQPEILRARIREAAAAFMAAGVDPAQSILFNQSQVSAHAEMAWLFNTVARVGWMYRMTQFKDKAGKNSENASLGLLAYPALMAADILTYQATAVPVGEDQKQHLELTRDIAAKFNHDYGVTHFPITEPLIEGVATRVMSLRDGSRKMSKSDPSDASRINLTDDADAIAQKIRKARTDAEPLPDRIEDLKDRPEARNLVNIYAALADETPGSVLARFEGQGFGAFKPALAELAVASLSPITRKMAEYMADPAEIDRILGEGAARADAVAQPILNRTKDVMGLLRSKGGIAGR
ncbi:tryptophan--tRNA ligase [Paracoccus spongiarum]|uniref:Tryptophan--tRNA ligase n=1 Tax=Paracoccus spongiarum TaxID=3064387 RepID=A0ABT9J9E2_9RHOB|nr:tryptophan--tRNA ligase [Paracoccus sp. 2205BS29-5]MDP5306350.1 tryptophan--tRNA ligase [Paracoccus sp. 2205BS29-5]